MKRNLLKHTVVALTCAMCLTGPSVSAQTQAEIAVNNFNLRSNFELTVSEKDGTLQAAVWELRDYNKWVNDADSVYVSEIAGKDNVSVVTSEEYPGVGGTYAIKTRQKGNQVARMLRQPIYNQTPGTLYKLTARIYLHQAEGDTTSVEAYLGASSNENTSDNFLTVGALNPQGLNYNSGGISTGVYNQWITVTRYFVNKIDWFNVYLGANVKGSQNNYVLWDDIKVEIIDKVQFEQNIEEIKGGETYNAQLLLGNIDTSAKNYTAISAVYERTNNGTKQLKNIEIVPFELPGVGQYKPGQYRQDITFDLTDSTVYSEEADYTIKVMLWNDLSNIVPVYMSEKD